MDQVANDAFEERLGEFALNGRWVLGCGLGGHVQMSCLVSGLDKVRVLLRLIRFHDLGAGADKLDEEKTRVKESGGEAAILAGARPAKLVNPRSG